MTQQQGDLQGQRVRDRQMQAAALANRRIFPGRPFGVHLRTLVVWPRAAKVAQARWRSLAQLSLRPATAATIGS